MPNMNRIRVNNVKYNFGTQMYDDFVMRFHGSNTIYDLANGGGKSVLMLLMMQNLIPNCTLDEKQPIEKLFRTEGGSKTIHSLVEWNLDESDIVEDYRYMLTGFTARKAKDSDEGETGGRDTASIEYFNYCIFYRAYNSNDIVNLPLDKDGERITYNGLREYLKDLSRENPDLKVYIFDRKGEYQRFISQYGLYESAWEIIRGINKTEGHVRTYFETNYKTTRKVVEDLLIEEIIERSFRDKTEGEDVTDSMSKTLLEIRDKLMELSMKKSEISAYDRQKEVLSVLNGRISSLSEMFKEKESYKIELLSAYRSLENQIDAMERDLKGKKNEIESIEHDCVAKERNLACMGVQIEEYALARAIKEEEEAVKRIENVKKDLTEAKAKYIRHANINDFLEYAKYRKKREENAAVIAKGKGGEGDSVDRLSDYASVKKKFLDERLKSVRDKSVACGNEEHELKVSLKTLMKAKRDLECSNAVAFAEEARIKKNLDRLDKELNVERKKTSLLLLEDATKLLREYERKLNGAEKEYRKNEEQLKKIDSMSYEINLKRREYEAVLSHVKDSEGKADKLESLIEAGRARAEALVTAYGKELPNKDLSELYKHLLGKYKRAVLEWNEGVKSYDKLKKQIEAREEGRQVANLELLSEIRDYIADRHGIDADLGQDYILGLDEGERAEVLRNWPYLAVSIVVDATDADITGINDDRYLRELASETLIPVISKDALGEGVKTAKGMVFLSGREDIFLDANAGMDGLSELQARLSRLELSNTQLEDMCKVYEEDAYFVMEQIQLKGILDSVLADAPENVVDYNAELANLDEEEKALVEEEKKIHEVMEVVNEQGVSIKKEIAILEHIEELYKEFEAVGAEHQEALDQANVLKAQLDDVSARIDDDNSRLKEVRELKKNYDEQIFEGEKLWNEQYAEYYKGKPVLDLGYNEEQLDVEFKAMRAVVEKRLANLEDKQALIDTFDRNMDKLMKGLKRRNADLDEFEKLYASGDLVMVSSSEIDRLEANVDKYTAKLDEVREAEDGVRLNRSRLEGVIEHGKKVLASEGISYQRVDVTEEELSRIIDDEKKQLNELVKHKAELTDAFIQGQKLMSKKQDIYKDVKRLKSLYNLEMEDESKLIDMSEYKVDQLKACQEAFEQSIRKEQRAKVDLEDYKMKAAETLKELEAYELAEVVKRDINLPDSISGFDDLEISLNDMIGFINLEQERIEQGISDMELIKSNFESQCILRCQDVKTELKRLAKLSMITLDNEPVSMISLNIPYLDDDEVRESMSSYIDEIVKGVDRYDNPDDRIKFIRNGLSLKRMFSAVVTDMNAIKLMLYKRERIREQSRYLKYEEAVGSTGQSQGIYIQFLISIINYIANIHAVNSDNNTLKKVIFIDNPFGAAKDIYIWEPIFEMLKVNNVQLIVPARGTTPAITGRFDVNYVLEQKLVGDKQQTVVADYRSQIDKAEVEYKKVDYSQNSFEFI